MIAVSGGWEDRQCLLEKVPRNLLRFKSFLGFVESLCDS